MKSDELYHQLKDLAEKLDITVKEQNLKHPGIKVKSGLCTVKGKQLFIMDKHISIRDKVDILAECLSVMQLENVYMMPAIRDVLEKFQPKP